MAKFKLKIKAVPEFKLPISFTMPNGDEAEVVFTALHKKPKEVTELFNKPEDERPNDVDFILQFVKGWDLEEEFNRENLLEACELFPAMVVNFSYGYIQALTGNRAKN